MRTYSKHIFGGDLLKDRKRKIAGRPNKHDIPDPTKEPITRPVRKSDGR